MKKLTLYIPDELFDHLATLPGFLDYDKEKDPVMLLPEGYIAEIDVLYKLGEIYNKYEDEHSDVMEDACSKRIDSINRMAIEHCRKNGIELIDVDGNNENFILKNPINLKQGG